LQQMQQHKTGQPATSSSRGLLTSKLPTAASSSSAATAKSERGFGWKLGSAKAEPATQIGSGETKENKPSASSSAPPSSSSAVLTEKKVNPAEYRQVTPSKAFQQAKKPATPASSAPTSTTAPSPPREEYKIDDDDDDESDDGSGTDDDEEDKKKQIPDWAKGPKLREALEQQYGLNGHTAVDPDQIFTEVQTCSLEEIFGKREGKCGK
jgi:hypothetical protein